MQQRKKNAYFGNLNYGKSTEHSTCFFLHTQQSSALLEGQYSTGM